jgi:hypothetical protein
MVIPIGLPLLVPELAVVWVLKAAPAVGERLLSRNGYGSDLKTN